MGSWWVKRHEPDGHPALPHSNAAASFLALPLVALGGVPRRSRLGGTAGAAVVCRARTCGPPHAGGAPPFAKATGDKQVPPYTTARACLAKPTLLDSNGKG